MTRLPCVTITLDGFTHHVEHVLLNVPGVGTVHAYSDGHDEASVSRLGVFWFGCDLTGTDFAPDFSGDPDARWTKVDEGECPDLPSVIAAMEKWREIREAVVDRLPVTDRVGRVSPWRVVHTT